MAQQIRAALRLVIVIVVALAALAALMSVRQSAEVPAALDAGGGGSSAAALPAAIQSDPPVASVPSDSLPILNVQDARAAAQRMLIEGFGATCMMEGDGDIFYPPGAARELDEKITAAKVTGEGWVVEGELWLGSPEKAAKAFGASTVYADEHSVWMFIVTDDVPRARELLQSRSESGKVTWAPFNQISPCVSETSDDD